MTTVEDGWQEEEEQAQAGGQRLAAGAGTSGSGSDRQLFARGTIKKVKVHDFMTYSGTVTISPGARLNLVLGPNGTGKSSFVCALCIGLNGSPKTLGRADNLKDSVRRGAEAFWTEITLSSGGPGPDFKVRRSVTLRRPDRDAPQDKAVTRYESKWAINGQESSAKDVDKLGKDLNLQFDNLCQMCTVPHHRMYRTIMCTAVPRFRMSRTARPAKRRSQGLQHMASSI